MTQPQTPPQPCDLLIEAGWVIPVEPHRVVLERHAIAVDAGNIVALLPIDDARTRFAAKERVELPHSVVLPGLVNVHTHNPMTLMRGLADDLDLMTWLRDHIWPAEGAVMSAAFCADGAEYAVAEMLRGGTTCCNENYFFPDAIAATYKRHGFRARVGLPVIDFPSAWASSSAEYFAKAEQVHDQYRRDPLIATSFAPHAPYTVSDDNFERIRMLSDQLDVPVHLHLHETAAEIEESLKQYGQRPFARVQRLGIVNASLLAVHMTQLNEGEIMACAEHGVSVAHCPESNLKLASGFCPAEALRKAGVNLALGTDGCASNNDLDMFGEIKTAAILAKAVANDAAAMDAASALRMATLGSARAMQLDDRIGSIEPGKAADLISLRLDNIESQPFYDLIAQLVYAGSRSQVRDVWIAGKRKLRDGELVDMDVQRLIATAGEWRDRIGAARRGATA